MITCREQGAADLVYPGLAQRRQRAGINMLARFQFGKASDLQSQSRTLLGAVLPQMFDPDHEARVPAGNVESELVRSPGVVLVDTVARLQTKYEGIAN